VFRRAIGEVELQRRGRTYIPGRGPGDLAISSKI